MAARGQVRRPGRLARFGMTACVGIAGYCVVALFTAHGQAHLFDVGAVLAGIGIALVLGLVKWLAGINWGDVAAAVVLASFWDALTRPWH